MTNRKHLRRRNMRPYKGLRPGLSRSSTGTAAFLPGAPVRWRMHVGGPIRSAPSVAEGTVYVAGHGLWALDTADGTVRWTHPDAGFMSAPTVVGDSVYVAGYFRFFALDAADGRTRWRRRMNRWSQTPPAVGDGLLHYVNDSQYLRTLDAATGRRRWRTKYRRIRWNDSAPVLADGTLYAVDDRGTVRAFDPVTGRTRWQQSTSAVSAQYAVGARRLPLPGTRLGFHVYALDAATGAHRGKHGPTSRVSAASRQRPRSTATPCTSVRGITAFMHSTRPPAKPDGMSSRAARSTPPRWWRTARSTSAALTVICGQ